jgi:hypothetical protein
LSLCFDYASERPGLHEEKKIAEHDIRLHTLVNWDDVLSTGLSKNISLTKPTGKSWIFSKIRE